MSTTPIASNQPLAALTSEIFPGEVFAATGDFDSGIRQLLPRYDDRKTGIQAPSF